MFNWAKIATLCLVLTLGYLPLSAQVETTPSLCEIIECFESKAVAPEDLAGIDSQEERVIIGNMKGKVKNLHGISEFFAGSIYRKQESISDSILDAIGDFSVDFDIIDREWQYAGGEDAFRITLPLEFRPQRSVFVNNVGKIDENGQLEENGLSRYTVIDGMISRLNPRFRMNFGILDGANVTVPLEAGIAVKFVSQRDHLRELSPLAPRSVRDILEINDSSELIAEKKSFLKGLGKYAKKVFNALEKGIQKGAKNFYEDDKTAVFFEGLFDPTRAGVKFFNVNSKKVLDNMKEGEILNVVFFTSVGIGGEVHAANVLRMDMGHVWRLAYSIVIRKEKGNVVRAKYIVSAKKGWTIRPVLVRVRVGLGPISVSYTPFFWRLKRENYNVGETYYEYDLNRETARKAFNALTKKARPDLALSEKEAALDNGSVRKFWTRLTDGFSSQNIGKGDIGLLRGKKGSTCSVEDRDVIMPDGSVKTDLEGQNEFIHEWQVRWPKFWKEDENLRKSLRSYAIFDQNNVVEGLDIRISALFDDEVTTQKEYTKYLNHIENSLDLQGQLFPPEVKNRRIPHKKWQYAYLDLYFTQDIVARVLNRSDKEVWATIAHFFTGNPKAWPTLGRFPEGRRQAECRASEYPGIFSVFSKSTVLCGQMHNKAKVMFEYFQKIKVEKDDRERLALFNKLHRKLGGKAALSQLIIRLGVDGSIFQYSIDKKEIEYRVELAGADLSESLVFEAGDVSRLDVMRVEDIVDLEEIRNSEKRLVDAQVFSYKSELEKDNPRIFMEFDGLMSAKPQDLVGGWLFAYRTLRGDKLLAGTTVRDLLPVPVQGGDAEKQKYRYTLELSQEFNLARNKNYTIQYRLENPNTALTEISEVWFKIPKK